jgi:hypothetical protein
MLFLALLAGGAVLRLGLACLPEPDLNLNLLAGIPIIGG